MTQTSISMESILALLTQFSYDNKKWLADKLYEQVSEEYTKKVLSSNAYREASDDVDNGRVTEYASAQALFDKFGI